LSNAKAICIRDNNGPNDKSSTMDNGENIKYGSIDSIFTLCGKEKLISPNREAVERHHDKYNIKCNWITEVETFDQGVV
jgi:hypothetical protein